MKKLRRFKAYPAYKDSGIEWLGKIPAHWEVKRIKRVFEVVNGATPKSEEPRYWDGDIPWVTPDDLGELTSKELLEPRRYITQEGYQSCGTSIVPRGSLVLSTRAPIGHLVIAGVNLCTNQGCRSLVFRKDHDQNFFYYLLFSARSELESWGQGSTFKELSKSNLEYIPLVEPPLKEQQLISIFLDRETAKIDALICKKERLIELLQEKRTALISHAVTKGLNPNVPMKDSGIEWLGKIPAHWETVPLKYCAAKKPNAIKTGPFGSQLLFSEMLSGEIKVYNQRTVLDNDFMSGDNYITQDKFKQLMPFMVEPGDILLTTRGTIGKCAIVPKDAEIGILHPCLMRIQPDTSKILPKYLVLLIQDSILVQTQIKLASNATTIDVIYSETMKEIKIPLPPIKEQFDIIDVIGQGALKIGAISIKIRKAIDFLKEYRTTLISAAVTGKIDVRGEMA